MSADTKATIIGGTAGQWREMYERECAKNSRLEPALTEANQIIAWVEDVLARRRVPDFALSFPVVIRAQDVMSERVAIALLRRARALVETHPMIDGIHPDHCSPAACLACGIRAELAERAR